MEENYYRGTEIREETCRNRTSVSSVPAVVNDFRRSDKKMQPSCNTASQTLTAMSDDSDTPIPAIFLRGDASEAMAPGNGGEREARGPRSSHAGPALGDTMHALANAVTAVLMNTQVLDWKLPPYSRLKRPVREIERHAQRGGALLKRLLLQFEATGEIGIDLCPQVSSLHGPVLGNIAAVTGPDANAAELATLPSLAPLPPAPGSGLSAGIELTSLCDPCTSAFFPKEE